MPKPSRNPSVNHLVVQMKHARVDNLLRSAYRNGADIQSGWSSYLTLGDYHITESKIIKQSTERNWSGVILRVEAKDGTLQATLPFKQMPDGNLRIDYSHKSFSSHYSTERLQQALEADFKTTLHITKDRIGMLRTMGWAKEVDEGRIQTSNGKIHITPEVDSEPELKSIEQEIPPADLSNYQSYPDTDNQITYSSDEPPPLQLLHSHRDIFSEITPVAKPPKLGEIGRLWTQEHIFASMATIPDSARPSNNNDKLSRIAEESNSDRSQSSSFGHSLSFFPRISRDSIDKDTLAETVINPNQKDAYRI